MEFMASTKKSREDRWRITTSIISSERGHTLVIFPARVRFGYLSWGVTPQELARECGGRSFCVRNGIYFSEACIFKEDVIDLQKKVINFFVDSLRKEISNLDPIPEENMILQSCPTESFVQLSTPPFGGNTAKI